MYHTPSIKSLLTIAAGAATLLCLQFGLTLTAVADADPAFSFYGYQQIVANPSPAIANENTQITVTVANLGDAPATNVHVKLSYNDWGVTFQGWQEIDVVVIPSIPTGGTAAAEFDHVFTNRAHTCLEALIVSADQNADLNNDRGQINMEVVNAGESFAYGVPIVNNGEDDLVVQVRAECVRDDAAGAVVGRCRGIDELIRVPAGQEIFVPVQVEFFRDTPRGTPIDIVVKAFDVLSPDDVHAMNHVVVRVVYNTSRGLMEDCLAALDALPLLPSPGKGKRSNGLAKKIDEIASHIDKALASDAWVGDSRLESHPRAIPLVYEQSAVAVQQLLTLIESNDLPIEWKIELNQCVRDLTDAARILLQTAIRDAGGNLEAELLLEEGDALRLAGDEKNAVRKYRTGHVSILK